VMFPLGSKYSVKTEVGLVIWYALIIGGFVVIGYATRRAEHRMADTLSVRVTHSAAISLRDTLGRFRFAYLVVNVLLPAAVGVVFSVANPGLLSSVTLLSVLSAIAISVTGMLHEVRRPAIAVDASSLQLDERLRSDAVYSDSQLASSALPLLLPAVMAEAGTGHILILLGAAWVGLLLLQVLGEQSPPWNPLTLSRLMRDLRASVG
jgi:hypothetical protein